MITTSLLKEARTLDELFTAVVKASPGRRALSNPALIGRLGDSFKSLKDVPEFLGPYAKEYEGHIYFENLPESFGEQGKLLSQVNAPVADVARTMEASGAGGAETSQAERSDIILGSDKESLLETPVIKVTPEQAITGKAASPVAETVPPASAIPPAEKAPMTQAQRADANLGPGDSVTPEAVAPTTATPVTQTTSQPAEVPATPEAKVAPASSTASAVPVTPSTTKPKPSTPTPVTPTAANAASAPVAAQVKTRQQIIDEAKVAVGDTGKDKKSWLGRAAQTVKDLGVVGTGVGGLGYAVYALLGGKTPVPDKNKDTTEGNKTPPTSTGPKTKTEQPAETTQQNTSGIPPIYLDAYEQAKIDSVASGHGNLSEEQFLLNLYGTKNANSIKGTVPVTKVDTPRGPTIMERLGQGIADAAQYAGDGTVGANQRAAQARNLDIQKQQLAKSMSDYDKLMSQFATNSVDRREDHQNAMELADFRSSHMPSKKQQALSEMTYRLYALYEPQREMNANMRLRDPKVKEIAPFAEWSKEALNQISSIYQD